VTVVSSADKTLLITAPGFHELKVSSREQIRLRPRVLRRRQLVLQSLRTSTRSSRLFDQIIVYVLDESENNKSPTLSLSFSLSSPLLYLSHTRIHITRAHVEKNIRSLERNKINWIDCYRNNTVNQQIIIIS